MRWWLEGRAHHDQLIIVTGWGKHRRGWQRDDLHGRVTRVLAAVGVPTRPTDNPGAVLVDYGYGAAAARLLANRVRSEAQRRRSVPRPAAETERSTSGRRESYKL